MSQQELELAVAQATGESLRTIQEFTRFYATGSGSYFAMGALWAAEKRQMSAESLARIRQRLGADVSLAFVHFPILQIHPNAGNASAVAICAGEQGKFWPMHDLLFKRQQEWERLQ